MSTTIKEWKGLATTTGIDKTEVMASLYYNPDRRAYNLYANVVLERVPGSFTISPMEAGRETVLKVAGRRSKKTDAEALAAAEAALPRVCEVAERNYAAAQERASR